MAPLQISSILYSSYQDPSTFIDECDVERTNSMHKYDELYASKRRASKELLADVILDFRENLRHQSNAIFTEKEQIAQ